MADNLSETDLNEKFYQTSDDDKELDEKTKASDDDDKPTVDDDEEDDEDDKVTQDEDGTISFKGEEITVDQLGEMHLAFENRKHLQADYSKKTQAAANQMSLATAELEKFQGLNTSLQESVDAMDQMLTEEEKHIADALEDDDSVLAMKLRLKLDKKRGDIKAARAKNAKAEKQVKHAQITEQSNILKGLIPEWYASNGRVSKTQKADMKVINQYLDDKGYPADHQNQISTAREWEVLRDAANHHALQQKKPKIKEKLSKVKTVDDKAKPTKGKSLNEMTAKEANSLFYGT